MIATVSTSVSADSVVPIASAVATYDEKENTLLRNEMGDVTRRNAALQATGKLVSQGPSVGQHLRRAALDLQASVAVALFTALFAFASGLISAWPATMFIAGSAIAHTVGLIEISSIKSKIRGQS